MLERDIQREIMLALSAAGCVVWRNNTGGIKGEDGRFHQFGLCVGSADLIGIAPGGKFLAVEVKSSRGRLTKEQENFLRVVRQRGGVAGVARSAEEAVKLVVDGSAARE